MLPTSSTSKPVPAWAQSTADQPAPIDRLYARLEGMYLARWRANFHTPEAIEAWSDAWADALSRHRVSPKCAFAALQALELSGGGPPPTLPEFLALCQPQRMNYHEAFLHAARNMEIRAGGEPGDWPESAIYWAAQDFGLYELRTQNFRQSEALWRRCLDRRRTSECPDVPEVMAALPAPAFDMAGKAMTSEEAKAAAKVAIAGMMTRAASPQVSLARARAILADEGNGKSVTPAIADWARAVVKRLGHSDAEATPADWPNNDG